MIDRARLLADLKPLTRRLIDDLRTRSDSVPEVREPVRAQHDAARQAGRTDRSFQEWREDLLAQVAVGWVLGSVFVRFCEDNGLVPDPLLSGPGGRRTLAGDHRTHWLAGRPTAGDREWLTEVFRRYQSIPATSGVFGTHNPLWQFGPSDDGARELREFWWQLDPDSGELRHDFTDPALDTRFLGDLYQDLSDHAKKAYALLQTPDFVEEFILDRTLDPAMRTFGLATVRMIDPTCGSGHFLLGSFQRLLARWGEREPATPVRERVQKALDGVYGVDLNPFAVAIARFRLLVEALRAAGIRRLSDAPDFRIHVATGDSLLHGELRGELFDAGETFGALLQHRYPSEDGVDAADILQLGRYHAVVGNPPYITVKEPALRDAYRSLYATAYRQYSLGVPFTERFFDLAQPGGPGRPAGYVGMITANSFMKREFGKKLIEEYLVQKDLTHVIDTSGAYIPGHGTPTVILFARNQRPEGETVRALLGIRGEPGRPEDPARGRVWSSIVHMVGGSEAEDEFLSVEDLPRGRLRRHPWSLQGGAAPVLAQAIGRAAEVRLGAVVDEVGFGVVTREDDVFRIGAGAALRAGIDPEHQRPLVAGEEVRDWGFTSLTSAIWPYSVETLDAQADPALVRFLWAFRRQLSDRVAYGKTQLERGREWWEYSMFFADRFRTPLSITFAFVATHNHFVLDRGGKVFNRTAPVIKLPDGATEEDHLPLLGLLNSSTACFWMKQVFFNRGDSTDSSGARVTGVEGWIDSYEHDGTKLKLFPIPADSPLALARHLDDLAGELDRTLPGHLLREHPPTRALLADARTRAASLRARMVALQEELDWECYHLYGLTEEPLTLPPEQVPELKRGERAFEIALARAMAQGTATSTWFERHGTTPVTELPAHWPTAYRERVDGRLERIRSDRKIRLLERPEYKRRWNWDSWEELERTALREWILDRIEGLGLWRAGTLQTVSRVADALGRDAAVREAAELLAGRRDVDLAELVGSLVAEEGVPFVAALRLRESGLRKYREWERTWELQRVEDALAARAALPPHDPGHLDEEAHRREREAAGVDRIPVPPKYTSADFAGTAVWRHRGKLDVPKERFILYPGTRAGADDTPVVGWAGWNHLERARALAGHYSERKDAGAHPSELLALLAGLQELVPWLVQWHNDLDLQYGGRMGDFFRTFVETEARGLGTTPHDLRTWTPSGAAPRD